MVDNTQKANPIPLNTVQEQAIDPQASSPEVRRVSNTSIVLATLGIGLAIALIAVGVVTLPLSAIAGVVCIALGIGIGISAGTQLILEGHQYLKKTEQDTAAAPIELQTPKTETSADTPAPKEVLPKDLGSPNRLRRGSAQATPPQEYWGIHSKELLNVRKNDLKAKSIKNKIAENIIEKNGISPVLKEHVLTLIDIYTDLECKDYYLDVKANGECFYRCALIALTQDYTYALLDIDFIEKEIDIFRLFEEKVGIDLATVFQTALVKTNDIYEETGLSINNSNIRIDRFLNHLHNPKVLHRLLFPRSQLYRYKAENPENTPELQQYFMLLLSQMGAVYNSERIDDWLITNTAFDGKNIDKERFHADLEKMHQELQYTAMVSDCYFTILGEYLPPEVRSKMNVMASSNHYLYRLNLDDKNIVVEEEAGALGGNQLQF